jgi:hypothetical protein
MLIYLTVVVPAMGAGRCLGPEGNGVSLGKGGEGGPGPQEARKISSQCSAREEAAWRRKKMEGQVTGMMKNDWCEQS